jgi:hypothetical protein
VSFISAAAVLQEIFFAVASDFILRRIDSALFNLNSRPESFVDVFSAMVCRIEVACFSCFAAFDAADVHAHARVIPAIQERISYND